MISDELITVKITDSGELLAEWQCTILDKRYWDYIITTDINIPTDTLIEQCKEQMEYVQDALLAEKERDVYGLGDS